MSDKKLNINSQLVAELEIKQLDLDQFLETLSAFDNIFEYHEINKIPAYAQCKFESLGC